MIIKEQLRIGNTIIVPGNDSIQYANVVSILSTGILHVIRENNIRQRISDTVCNSVEISDSILQKCGLTKIGNEFTIDAKGTFVIHKLNHKYHLSRNYLQVGEEIDSLHRLQNLHFSLFNKELILNHG